MNKFRIIRKKLFISYMWSWDLKNYLLLKFTKSERYYIYKFLLYLRKYEYLSAKRGLISKIRRIWCSRKFRHYGNICGYMIEAGVLGDNVVLYHKGNVIINGCAKVGEGVKIHGDCVIGVGKTGESACPVIGKNVDIGVGAKILGDIYIADNIVIGANAVVNRSFYEPGVTIAGIPAKIVKC